MHCWVCSLVRHVAAIEARRNAGRHHLQPIVRTMPDTKSRGVASSAMERPLKGLSAKQILALTVTNGCQGVMLTMPFTVAVYMVRSFLQKANSSSSTLLLRESNTAATVGSDGFADVDEQLVGQLTGTLAAVYSFSQFTTSYAWGLVSNKIGRKPIMILGTFVSTAGLIWFGLAGNFASAAAARALAGLLNGIIVAWKCMLGESCDSLTQGRVMSYMSLAWGVGCIAGPTIGGMLSQPCNTWHEMPGCHEGGLLRLRPYFLPCAVAAALSALSLIANIILLEETLPAILARRSNRRQQRQQYTLLPAAAAAAAAAAEDDKDVQHTEQQGARSYRRVMSNSVSPYIAKIMRDRVMHHGSSSSSSAGLAAAAASEDAENSESHDLHYPGSDLAPFVSVQVDQMHASSSSSNSTAEVPANPRFLNRAAAAKSLQLRSALSDHDLSNGNTDRIDAAAAAGSSGSSCSDEGVVQVIEDRQQDLDSNLADTVKAGDNLICSSSSSSSRWPSRLRWDSAWQLFHRDSSSSSSIRYKKLQQQQQQPQQQQDHQQVSDLADAINANNSLIHNSSSSSSRWPSLLRKDSAWKFFSRDSNSSRSVKYSKIQQQQQDPDQQDLIVEMGSLAVKDQDPGYAAAAAEGSSTPLSTALHPDRQQQQHQVADLLDLTPTSATAAAPAAAAAPWYKQRSVVLSLLGYGNTCLLFCALDELTPMFASAPLKQGGLSLHEVQLAGPLAFNGVCLMFISLLAYPPLQRAIGTLPLTRIGLILAIITALLTPAARFAVTGSSSSSSSRLITSLPQHAAVTKGLSSSTGHGTIGRKLLGADLDLNTHSNPTNISHTAAAGSSSSTDIGPAAWAILYISMLLKSASSCPAFTGSMILVNSLPAPEHLGQVNGVGQSFASLARGIGPAMGGVLWGATVKVAAPGAQMLPFMFVALSAAAGWVLYNFVEMPDRKELRQQQQGSSCCME